MSRPILPIVRRDRSPSRAESSGPESTNTSRTAPSAREPCEGNVYTPPIGDPSPDPTVRSACRRKSRGTRGQPPQKRGRPSTSYGSAPAFGGRFVVLHGIEREMDRNLGVLTQCRAPVEPCVDRGLTLQDDPTKRRELGNTGPAYGRNCLLPGALGTDCRPTGRFLPVN